MSIRETGDNQDFSELKASTVSPSYLELMDYLEHRASESQTRVAQVLNAELVMLYWSIGREILAQQSDKNWGDGIIGQIAEDLRLSIGPNLGFSQRNLFFMRHFASLWPDLEKMPSELTQLAWAGHRILLDKVSHRPELYEWYCAKAVANRWSENELEYQISLGLHERQGTAFNNSLTTEPSDH